MKNIILFETNNIEGDKVSEYDSFIKKVIIFFLLSFFIIVSVNFYEKIENKKRYEDFIIQLDTELNNVITRIDQTLHEHHTSSPESDSVHVYLYHTETSFNRLEVLFYSAHHFLSEDIERVSYFSRQHFGTYAKGGSLTEEEEHLILLKEQLSYLQSILFEDRSSLKKLISIDELNRFLNYSL
ncbi:hypothetical protein ACM26V_04930 [Salipaludibacillus sp. HK11]|uniref:hypothetical protein n=1 Tax=Salipaludibacillus sp. HK11 TaxID=3394320 RepID=UPI0039FBB234